MKKTLIIVILSFLLLFNYAFTCNKIITFPDMVEFTKEEVFDKVKEKYNIKYYIFHDIELYGEVNLENGQFEVTTHDIFSNKFINGSNIEGALTSFAGVNGNNHIQANYKYFLCYVALGIDSIGNAKFIYYNYNIDKNKNLIDTIGSSDYPYDVLPTEVTNDLFNVSYNWGVMSSYLNKHFKDRGPVFNFSKERLSFGYKEKFNQYVYVEIYKEFDEVVFDLYYIEDINLSDVGKLIYSSSSRYGVVYNYYGFDQSDYLDINYQILCDENNTYLLDGYIKVKNIDNIIYSQINVGTYYYILDNDNEAKVFNNQTMHLFKDYVDINVLLENIDNVNHEESAYIYCPRFYVLYEK